MTKKIIAIIAGGDSSEHDVSMHSAEGIASWLDRDKFIVYTIEVRGLDWIVQLPDGNTAEVNRHDFSFMENGKKVKPDFAYITIHGTPGENGILQGYFELIHVPYSSCNVLAAAMTFDKFTLNHFLAVYGVKIAESMLVHGETISGDDVEKCVGFPCFVKPNASGSSFGVTHCTKKEEIAEAMEKARKECEDVMIEAELKGIEIANGVYRKSNGDVYVLPITEVVSENEFFDYDAKYNGQVKEITPARLSDDTTQRVKKLTKAIYDLIRANGIMRVDYIITKSEDGKDVINLLEINATPGMTKTSFIPQQAHADGLDMKDILTEVIEGKIGNNYD